MPWSTHAPILIWAAIFIPLTVFAFLVTVRNRVVVILLFLTYLAVNLYFILVINWVIVSYWLRFVPLLAAFFLLLRITRRWRRKPWLPERRSSDLALVIVLVVALVAAGVIDSLALRSYSFAGHPVQPLLIRYPMATGMYVITNGGNGLDGLGMNDSVRDWLGRRTSPSDAQAFAVDIAEMNTRGMLAWESFSKRFDRYVGYQEPVYAPCIGTVVHLETHHPEVRPFGTPSDPLGNRVVIDCVGVYVTVANLRQMESPVAVGEELSLYRVIGYLGNSGAPAVPHIRLFATTGSWDETGQPVPLLFEWKFQVRNGVYIR